MLSGYVSHVAFIVYTLFNIKGLTFVAHCIVGQALEVAR